MSTGIDPKIRKLAKDVDSEWSVLGQAETDVVELAQEVAKTWRVSDVQFIRLGRALAHRVEQLPRYERARAEFFRFGGTDGHLRQLAAENESNE